MIKVVVKMCGQKAFYEKCFANKKNWEPLPPSEGLSRNFYRQTFFYDKFAQFVTIATNLYSGANHREGDDIPIRIIAINKFFVKKGTKFDVNMGKNSEKIFTWEFFQNHTL